MLFWLYFCSAGHFRKPVRKSANPQIADLRFWFADLRTDFLPQTFAVKKLKSTANPQINSITEIVSAISKKKQTFIRFNVSTDLGWCISNVHHPLTKFLCCGKIISQRCCYSYSKMSWLKVKKLPTACFREGKLRRFEVAKGCTRRLWWHAHHV